MQNIYFHPRTLETVTQSLMEMFNEIVVKRYATDRSVVKTLTVPIEFGLPDKVFQNRAREESGETYYVNLPKIAFTLNGLSPAPDRATSVNEIRSFYSNLLGLNDLDDVTKDGQPTPFDFQYTLTIRTESFEDFSQIIEQILPYFNDSLYLRVKEFSFLNIERDLRVKITGVQPQLVDELDINNRKYINCVIGLSVDGYFYFPYSDAKIIKIINSRYFVDEFGDFGTSAVQASEYSTSGFLATSAGTLDLSAIPDSTSYEWSAYDPTDTLFTFTSATSF